MFTGRILLFAAVVTLGVSSGAQAQCWQIRQVNCNLNLVGVAKCIDCPMLCCTLWPPFPPTTDKAFQGSPGETILDQPVPIAEDQCCGKDPVNCEGGTCHWEAGFNTCYDCYFHTTSGAGC